MTAAPNLSRLRIGYAPYSAALDRPGDRRRFAGYARKRNIAFEIADPARAYDLVIVTENADISVWSRYDKGRVVYDLIDSYLAIPRSDLKGRLRGLAKFVAGQHRHLRFDYWRAIEAMCRHAAAVVCTTEEQKHDIEKFCANVHIILDLHTTVTREVKTDYAAGSVFQLVWEGLPATVDSLLLIKDVLREIDGKHAIALNVVTDPVSHRYLGRYGRRDTLDAVRGLCARVTLHEWSEQTCASIICGCDAAVIPLDLADPFAAGKPENKLLLLWRMGVPVIASASPAYTRAMNAASFDLVCADEGDWRRQLERIITDASLRADAGRRGRAYAEAHFSEEQMLARWDALFTALI
jgi:glycosyltransferase involved in cell wall biosynthesis